jgi:hypothetical protein
MTTTKTYQSIPKQMTTNFETMKRIAVYPKDVMRITGKSERYSREILKKIKTDLNKEKHQLITIHEFCRYMAIDEVTINNFF